MNSEVLATLPRVKAEEDKPEYAILARLDGKATFKFLLMPKELRMEKTGEYPSVSAGGDSPFVSWAGNQSEILAMDIPISGYPSRDITAYVQSLIDLQLPDKDKGTPPVLAWKWGARTFSPCIMPRASKQETEWHKSGKLLSCIVSISLVKVARESIII